MRVREVNFYDSILSSIIIEDDKSCYLEVCYSDSKSIYIYDKESENLSEFMSTNNLKGKYIVDKYREKVYRYLTDEGELIVEEVTFSENIEVFKCPIGVNERLLDIFVVNEYLFAIYKNSRDFTKGFVYSIEESISVEITDRAFLETVGKKIFFEQDDILYMIIEESYYSGKELIELRKTYGNNEFTRNAIVLYDFNTLVDEIISKKPLSKNIIIDSIGHEYVSLLGIHNKKIVVFNKKEKNKLIYFSIDDNISFKTIDKEISSIISKGDLIFVYKNSNKKKIIDKDNNIIYSYKEIERNGDIEVRALIDKRILVYSNNKVKGINFYDIVTGDVKNFQCDFLMVDKILV